MSVLLGPSHAFSLKLFPLFGIACARGRNCALVVNMHGEWGTLTDPTPFIRPSRCLAVLPLGGLLLLRCRIPDPGFKRRYRSLRPSSAGEFAMTVAHAQTKRANSHRREGKDIE